MTLMEPFSTALDRSNGALNPVDTVIKSQFK